jgi:two-component system LytT family sensor kinase
MIMRVFRKNIGRYNGIVPILVWTFIFVLPFLLRIVLFRNDPRTGSLTDIFFSFLTIIAIFYVHTYLAYPLLGRRYGKSWYAVSLAGLLLFFFISMNYFMRDLSGLNAAHGLPPVPGKPKAARIALIFPFALVIFCSFSYRMYLDKIRQKELIKEMETTHLKTELDFLRSQVSPHFMFNLMNTLVSMARQKSELMEPSLISLSQLMRYMLYDSGSQKIGLAAEIEYLKNYINLQLLRFGDTVRFNLFLSGDPQGYAIEPMLLIPFVENAFKHGTANVDDPAIEVIVGIDNSRDRLELKVMNNVSRQKKRSESDSGIGLANVLRRLTLMYPDKHTISVQEKDDFYTVNLVINL